MGKEYVNAIEESGTDILTPQYVPAGYTNAYFTFACVFNGEKYNISWETFRKKYIEFGGDGIYAAWQLVYNEPCFKNNKIGWGKAPIAKNLQRNLMQFTCNQANPEEILKQKNCLTETINYFNKI